MTRVRAKADVIAEMLSRYEDAQSTLMGRSEATYGDGVLLMPKQWNRSFRELERCLHKMRDERPSQWWHVTERYLRCDDRIMEVAVRKGRPKLPPHVEVVAGAPMSGQKTARLRVHVWSPAVRAEKVRRGLEWLADEFRGEPYLPVEMTDLRVA